jgi:DNA-binding transcriptional regulator YiaG
MRNPSDFKEVIESWPGGVDTLAEDINAKPNTIRKWKERNRIPSSEWHKLIRAAGRRGIEGVNADVLTQIAGRS